VTDLARALELLEAMAYRKKFGKLYTSPIAVNPYPRQKEFFAQGATCRERLFMAANQVGKSSSGALETAYHLTGIYPDWWPGRRWDRPVKGWAAGETSLLVRNVSQTLLCGEPGVENSLGTGLLPKETILDTSLARGVTDALDTVQVKHISGGTSICRFKSYEQGRSKFQGETLDFVWWDEEPDEELYAEGMTRITATGGMEFLTFTPLLGHSQVVLRFIESKSPDRGITRMTIDDADHITEDDRKKIVAGYLPHQRDARARGLPLLGSGAIFQFSDDQISEPYISHIPAHWVKIWGLDFGVNHPFAAVLLLWDRDNDVIHVHHVIRMKDARARDHAAAMKPVGHAVPVAWPQDGTQRESGGATHASAYKAEGLEMLPSHAVWPEGGVSLEAGLAEMNDRMATGRLKVASHLSEWFEEKGLYHRKDGIVVKERDDVLSATRYGIMMKRFARAVSLGSHKNKRRFNTVAEGVDFELF
jgi:phage terminase large subunit-like protein